MTSRFEGVAIIGVGLLGASLGLALKKNDPSLSITGVGRTLASLEIARRRGAVDQITLDVREGVARSRLVVIATPTSSVIPTLDLVLAAAPPDAVILDVASTKEAICAHAQRVCGLPRRFVGCHPMAGSELYGPENGTAELYSGSVCLVEKDAALDPDAREQVCALWESAGARVADMDVRVHDAILARTSHAPHVTAAALALVAGEYGVPAEMVGNGFRDTTRIAESRAELWRDICLENRWALAETLSSLQEWLHRFEAYLTASDGPGLEQFFRDGAAARARVVKQ